MTRNEIFNSIIKKKSFLCVGLDTDAKKIPAHLRNLEDPVYEFNRQIIEATEEYCIAYKPNLAFYEANGPAGMISLQKTKNIIPADIFTIADAKRGDIGNTSELYARSFFSYYNFDAVTVAPYMGEDSVKPFLGIKEKWVIILALTSNSGSSDFQLSQLNNPGKNKLYEHVILNALKWGNADEIMFVIGATHPELFRNARKLSPDTFFLVPGVGAQGGNLREIAEAGMNSHCGLIVNSSRQILYASSGEDFAEAARKECRKLQIEMSQLLERLI